jgi:hypothetical protein
LLKHTYIYLYVALLVNSDFLKIQSYNLYTQYILTEVSQNIWYFYKSLLPKDLGISLSNHNKSALRLAISKGLKHQPSTLHSIKPSYLTTFQMYQFNLATQALKKLTIFYLNLLPYTYYSYNINFSIYNNYVWLSWYLRFNPMNNIFYLKIYNY